MMNRSAPLKRTPFKPQGYKPREPKVYEIHTPRARAVAVCDGKARVTLFLPRPKDAPVRDEAYRRLVATLPCAHCNRPGPSQAAHADSAGKGMGIKSPDSELMPLCADSPGRVGCHQIISSSGLFSKTQRRTLEQRYVQATKACLGKFK